MFSYGPHRQRYKQVATFAGPSTLTTWYVGGILEKVVATSTTHYKHFIQGPKGLVASYNRRSNGTTETLYYTHDHLGSVDSITTTAGAVSARLSYDLWGKRRNESGWTGALPGADWTAIGNSVRNGFTEHEHLDNIGLIHMNGRVYDPIIGRFMSADPFIPNPMSTQSFNRYSYMQNNPLSGTDPSGFDVYDKIVKNAQNGRRDTDRSGPPGGYSISGNMAALGASGGNYNFISMDRDANDQRIDRPPGVAGTGATPGTTDPGDQPGPSSVDPIDEHVDSSTTSCDGSFLRCSSGQVEDQNACIYGATAGISAAGGGACGTPDYSVQVIGLCPDGAGDLCDLTSAEPTSSDVDFAELGRAVGQRWNDYWSEEFVGDVAISVTILTAGAGISVAVTSVSRAQVANATRVIVLTGARILKEPGSRVPMPPPRAVPPPPPVTQPHVPTPSAPRIPDGR